MDVLSINLHLPKLRAVLLPEAKIQNLRNARTENNNNYAAAGFLESLASTEEGEKVLEAIVALLKK